MKKKIWVFQAPWAPTRLPGPGFTDEQKALEYAKAYIQEVYECEPGRITEGYAPGSWNVFCPYGEECVELLCMELETD